MFHASNVEKVKTIYIDVSVLHLFLEIRHFSLRRKYTVEMFLKPSHSTFFGGFLIFCDVTREALCQTKILF